MIIKRKKDEMERKENTFDRLSTSKRRREKFIYLAQVWGLSVN